MSVDISIDVGGRLGVSFDTVSPDARATIRAKLTSIRNDMRTFLLGVWPVKTAASLQEWEMRVVGLRLVLRNPLPYAEFVHRSGDPTLVWEELRDEAERLVALAMPDLQDALVRFPAAPRREDRPVLTVQGLITAALFRARARALERVPILTRDGIRNRIASRRPRARPLGR